MASDITGSGPALTEQDIASFEERVSRRIPTQYREFLLRHNGGYPEPSDFVIKGRGGEPDLMGTVEQFLGIGVEDEYAEIDRYLTVYKDRIPDDFFPIAQDPGGNAIVMATDSAEDGKIYFWDHEEEAEEGQPPTRDNLYLVADGLQDFLRNLS